jgi:hypothetical protein
MKKARQEAGPKAEGRLDLNSIIVEMYHVTTLNPYLWKADNNRPESMTETMLDTVLRHVERQSIYFVF